MINKEIDIVLPDIDVKDTPGMKLVSKAVSLTFAVILIALSLGALIIFLVRIETTIDAPGILEPQIKQIHSPESGIIRAVYIKSGDSVKAGQPIAVLDSVQISNELMQVRSEIALKKSSLYKEMGLIEFQKKENIIFLEKAESQLIKANASFRERSPEFFPNADVDSFYTNYVPGTHIALDYAIADIRSAVSEISNSKLMNEKLVLREYDLTDLRISLEKLNKQESVLSRRLKNLEIKSSISGVLLTEGIDELVNTYINEGILLFEIANTNKWFVTLFIPEDKIHEIKKDSRVKVEIEALKTSDNILYDADIISIAMEENKNKNKYTNFSGFRVSAELLIPKSDQLRFKNGYNIKGYIVTDSGTIAAFLLKHLM